MSEEQKNRVNVKIFNEEYVMRSPASVEYMKRLAEYVGGKMWQVSQKNNRLSLSKIAVLTSINLADELFRERSKVRELEMLLKKRPKK